MTSSNYTTRFYGVVLILIATMAIVGCNKTVVPEMPSAELPTYEVGTTYIYADGKRETVQAVSSNTVTWVDNQGNVSSGPTDIIYPRAKWETQTYVGERQFTTRYNMFTEDRSSLWPLEEGNEFYFTEKGIWGRKNGTMKDYTVRWNCDVVGKERVKVLAGEFDTWVIRGRRFSPSMYRYETKTWYYAPAIGLAVLEVRQLTDKKKPILKELVAVVPSTKNLPTEVHKALTDNLQQALEFNKSGKSRVWTDATTGLSGSTTPTGTFKLDDGTYCRNYTQNAFLKHGSRTYYGMACRNAKGHWITPQQ